MTANIPTALDTRIAALETELLQLKRQRTQLRGKPPKPLDGVRILDLSRFIFGPFCSQILADMGADVIKVEALGSGDPARRSGTVFVNGESASFFARNRNKRSMAINLRHSAAQDVMLRLAQQSDVLLHNFRPGVMQRMNLGVERVHGVNPRLVYCSLSGYGQSGPAANWPGQDILIQGMSGIVSTTGWENGPPVAVGTYLADVTGALTATYGILAALQAQAQYGIGQEVTVSLLDSMIMLQSMEATVYLNDGKTPTRSGSGHWMLPQPYGVYQTADEPMILNAHSDDWWARLCAAPEFTHLSEEPRFATRDARWQHGLELIAALEAILCTKPRAAWLDYLGQYDVLCAPVYTYEALFDDPQVQHNGIVVEQQHPVAGTVQVIGPVVNFSATPGAVGPASPRLGEHTEAILQQLGYQTTEIERLREAGTI
ncbi:MAG: CoA transferase [bacterium]|nr:CoA transferase [bacterium]